MSAWTMDIDDMEQGATWTLGFVYHLPTIDGDTGEVVVDDDGDPVPGAAKSLAGCTARMQIRKTVKSDEAIITATSLSLDDDPEFGERIILEAGDVTGRIDIVLTDADTDLMTITKGVYDLEVEYPITGSELRPFVERVLEGAVVNTLNVTKVDT